MLGHNRQMQVTLKSLPWDQMETRLLQNHYLHLALSSVLPNWYMIFPENSLRKSRAQDLPSQELLLGKLTQDRSSLPTAFINLEYLKHPTTVNRRFRWQPQALQGQSTERWAPRVRSHQSQAKPCHTPPGLYTPKQPSVQHPQGLLKFPQVLGVPCLSSLFPAPSTLKSRPAQHCTE